MSETPVRHISADEFLSQNRAPLSQEDLAVIDRARQDPYHPDVIAWVTAAVGEARYSEIVPALKEALEGAGFEWSEWEAQFDGYLQPTDPLDGLAIRAKQDSAVLFTPDVIAAAYESRENHDGVYVKVKQGLKGTGLGKEWDAAINAYQDKLKTEAKNRTRQLAAARHGARIIEGKRHYDLPQDVIARHTRTQGPYRMEPGVMIMEVERRDEIDVQVVAQFSAVIKREIVFADGTAPKRFEIEAVVGGKVSTVEVVASQFEKLEWVYTELSGDAILGNKTNTKSSVRYMIQIFSRPIYRDVVYGSVGWRVENGQRMYTHAGGIIGGQGTVMLPPRVTGLRHIELPPALVDEALKSGIRECSRLFFWGDRPEVTVPLFSLNWRAPLGGCRTVIVMQAEPELGKTMVACVGMNHFGTRFHPKQVPIAWNSSEFGISGVASLIRDCPLLIDDVSISGNEREDQKRFSDLDKVVRATYNGSGRVKGTAESVLTSDRAPSCSLVITVEELPRRYSLTSRVVMLRMTDRLSVTPGDIEEVYQKCRDGVYAGTMAAYIEWILPKYDQLQSEVEERTVAVRKQFASLTTSPRMVAELANLAVGLEFFLRFAIEKQALTEDDAVAIWKQSCDAFIEVIKSQEQVSTEENAAEKFLTLIRSSINTGQACLLGLDSGPPDNAELWGWHRKDSDSTALVPASIRLGYTDGEFVWLNRKRAVGLAIKSAREGGELFAGTERLVTDQLYRKGMLAKVEGKAPDGKVKTKTVRVTVKSRGVPNRVEGYLCLKATLLSEGNQQKLNISDGEEGVGTCDTLGNNDITTIDSTC